MIFNTSPHELERGDAHVLAGKEDGQSGPQILRSEGWPTEIHACHCQKADAADVEPGRILTNAKLGPENLTLANPPVQCSTNALRSDSRIYFREISIQSTSVNISQHTVNISQHNSQHDSLFYTYLL